MHGRRGVVRLQINTPMLFPTIKHNQTKSINQKTTSEIHQVKVSLITKVKVKVKYHTPVT